MAQEKSGRLGTVITLGTVVLALLIVAAAVANALQERSDALQRARQQGADLARIVEAQTIASMDSVDFALRSLQFDLLAGTHPQKGITAEMSKLVELLPFVQTVLQLDPEGALVSEASRRRGTATGFRIRDAFKYHSESSSIGLHIGKPFTSSRSGRPIFSLSRRLDSWDGAFAGVLSASVDIQYLQSAYARTESPYGPAILIARRDGTVLVPPDGAKDLAGAELRSNARLQAELARSPAGSYRAEQTFDGVTRLFSYRAVPGRDVVILVGFDEAQVLELWRRHVDFAALWSVLLIACVLAAGVVAFRTLKERQGVLDRLKRSEAHLAQAQRMARLGSWEYELHDASDLYRNPLRWSNETFRILGYPAGKTQTEHDEFVSRIHPEDLARVDRERQAALESRSSRDATYRIVRPDGEERIVRSVSAVVDDGLGMVPKLVGTIQDITEQARMEATLREAGVHLKLLSEQLLRVQEDERASLARDLHDALGQTLTAVKLHVQLAADANRPELLDCVKLIDEALRETRDLSLTLRPPLLQSDGLHAALESLTERVSRRTGVPISFDDAACSAPITGTRAAATFRIAQEAITNALRHGKPSKISVALSCTDVIALEIRDDGTGFQPGTPLGGGLGLMGMTERAEILGGRLRIESMPGGGCRVLARIPLDAEPLQYA